MNHQIKSALFLAIFTLAGLAAASDASASSDRDQRIESEQLQACVSEIRQHADYDDALRVVHQVSKHDQRNFWEMEIRITTSVYGKNEGNTIREYAVSCITVTTGNVLRFRINSVSGE